MSYTSWVKVPSRNIAKEGFHETTSKTTKKHPEIIRKEIITLLKSNPYLSRVDLAMAIGITEGSARHHLNKLKENGIIVHRGSDRKVVKKVYLFIRKLLCVSWIKMD